MRDAPLFKKMNECFEEDPMMPRLYRLYRLNRA